MTQSDTRQCEQIGSRAAKRKQKAVSQKFNPPPSMFKRNFGLIFSILLCNIFQNQWEHYPLTALFINITNNLLNIVGHSGIKLCCQPSWGT